MSTVFSVWGVRMMSECMGCLLVGRVMFKGHLLSLIPSWGSLFLMDNLQGFYLVSFCRIGMCLMSFWMSSLSSLNTQSTGKKSVLHHHKHLLNSSVYNLFWQMFHEWRPFQIIVLCMPDSLNKFIYICIIVLEKKLSDLWSKLIGKRYLVQ